MTRWIRIPLSLFTVGLLTQSCGDSNGGGGVNTPTGATPSAPIVVIELTEFDYQPRQVTIQPGQTVRWVLRGQDTTHTVTAMDGTFDSGFTFREPGSSFERRFTALDDGKTYEISCVSHSDCCNMKGSIRVGAGAPPPRDGY